MDISAATDWDSLDASDADTRYETAVAEFGPALSRLATTYEANPARREELEQDIHLQLWRSLDGFDGRCSLKTWVFRVAHNVAASHVARQRRRRMHESDEAPPEDIADTATGPEAIANRRLGAERLRALIRALPMPDMQVALLYLESASHEEIAAVTGLSPGAVATRISRIKQKLRQGFERGDGR